MASHLNMNKKFAYRVSGWMILFLLSAAPSWAHVIVEELEKMSKADTGLVYLRLGYLHILPLGFDHILFVLGLFLLNPKPKPVLMQATAFTLAHSVTLGLAMYHIITPQQKIVEPLIALSILYIAVENLFSPRLRPARVAVVFMFGLVHGLGFAGSLGRLGLPENAYLFSLIMFNLGVEFGQVTVILASYFLLGKWFGNKPYYRRLLVSPISVMIALVAGCWVVQRLLI